MGMPHLNPAEWMLVGLLGMCGSVVSGYGTLLVLGWAYNLPQAKHSRLGTMEDVLPLRGRWLGYLVMVVVTLVAVPLLLVSIGLFLVCLGLLLGQLSALRF